VPVTTTTPIKGPPPGTPPSRLRSPVVVGKARLGTLLASSQGSWTGAPIAFSYRWLRCSKTGGSCKAIKGATGLHHRVVVGDMTRRLRVVVVARNVVGPSAPVTSPATRLVPRCAVAKKARKSAKRPRYATCAAPRRKAARRRS
jgi:hypothetical protein